MSTLPKRARTPALHQAGEDARVTVCGRDARVTASRRSSLENMPSQMNQKRLALEAARLMVERVETEYLHAKERAILMLGLPYNTPYPTNRQIKECNSSIAGKPMKRADLGKVRGMVGK